MRMTEKDHVKVGPPVDERIDDGRKHDHGTAGPAPTGKRPYEHGEDVSSRMEFLKGNPFEVHSKNVEAPAQKKPVGNQSAQTK
jgi:hypothetical protein